MGLCRACVKAYLKTHTLEKPNLKCNIPWMRKMEPIEPMVQRRLQQSSGPFTSTSSLWWVTFGAFGMMIGGLLTRMFSTPPAEAADRMSAWFRGGCSQPPEAEVYWVPSPTFGIQKKMGQSHCGSWTLLPFFPGFFSAIHCSQIVCRATLGPPPMEAMCLAVATPKLCLAFWLKALVFGCLMAWQGFKAVGVRLVTRTFCSLMMHEMKYCQTL